jgi:hypothetical protein
MKLCVTEFVGSNNPLNDFREVTVNYNDTDAVLLKKEALYCIGCCTHRLKYQLDAHCSAQTKRVAFIIFLYQLCDRCADF